MGRVFGQGATEYLVLLAVVLVVALVSIVLLGFFPGMASDAKLSQSKAYWQSASPIAIVDGVANYEYGTGGYDEIILTLQNNYASPIEIVAFGPIRGTGIRNVAHAEYGDITERGIYQFFSPGWFSNEYSPNLEGTWGGYIGPPIGNGWVTQSEQKIVLSPGEKITLGFRASAQPPFLGYEHVSPCNYGSEKASNFYEFKQLIIYYVAYAEGGNKILKKQVGAKPLVLSCKEGMIF
ncbi:MAG: hypothetical protein QW275_03295 [Candidatus Anstonellaceae archaeon]